MLNTAAIKSLNDRLNSGDWDVVYAAALDAFVKSERTVSELFILAKAAHLASVTPGKTMVKFHADLVKNGFTKSRPTVANYAVAWAMAALTEDAATEPTLDRVAGAYRIVGNTKSKTRERLTEDIVAEDMAARGPFLDECIANYRDLDAAYAPAPVESEDAESEGEPEESVTDTEATVEGMLSVLTGITGQIKSGKISDPEALYALAKAAKGIIVAAEVVVTAQAKVAAAA